MSVLSYTAGDSEPAFDVQVKGRDGLPLDLTGVDHVEFRAKATIGSATVTRTGSVTDAANGWCRFTWATTDMSTVNIYNVQVRVYHTSTRWSNHPNVSYDALVVQREVQA